MKIICPYCGKKQDGNNAVCQFCGAKMGAMEPPKPTAGAEPESKAPTTALCNMCMKPFPVEQLTEHEGVKVCEECLKKIKKRETSIAPAMKKPVKEETLVKPGRKMFGVLAAGFVLIVALAYGVYFLWHTVSEQKGNQVSEAAKVLRPIIEKNDKAVAFLHQYESDGNLAADAITLLSEALAATSSEEVRAACASIPAIEHYKQGIKELLRKRLMAARTLAGKPDNGDPKTRDEALRLIKESDEGAVEIVAQLVKSLRLWKVSSEPFLLY